jgi:hypothetical protein
VEYANKTGMDLLSAAESSKKCRDCEEKLEGTMYYGQEHCGKCKIKHTEEKETETENNICFWGKDCDICSQLTEEERNESFVNECVECYKTMTDHEGYTEYEEHSRMTCNLCAAEYDFDQQEIIYNYAKEHGVSLQEAAIQFDSENN